MPGTTLVTGATGVLGHALSTLTGGSPSFVFVASREADLMDAAATRDLLMRVRPNRVVHLAAMTGAAAVLAQKPATALARNTGMTLNVMEAARTTGVRRMVIALSAAMYPAAAPSPVSEGSLFDGPAAEAFLGYAQAKRWASVALDAYRREHGIIGVGLAFPGLYGEHDRFEPETANLVPALVARCHAHRRSSGPIALKGDGLPLRDFLYAADGARALLWALDATDPPSLLNVVGGQPITVRDLARLIAELSGVDPDRLRFDGGGPAPARRTLDGSRFAALSGFTPIALRDGLARTIAWYRARHGG